MRCGRIIKRASVEFTGIYGNRRYLQWKGVFPYPERNAGIGPGCEDDDLLTILLRQGRRILAGCRPRPRWRTAPCACAIVCRRTAPARPRSERQDAPLVEEAAAVMRRLVVRIGASSQHEQERETGSPAERRASKSIKHAGLGRRRRLRNRNMPNGTAGQDAVRRVVTGRPRRDAPGGSLRCRVPGRPARERAPSRASR